MLGVLCFLSTTWFFSPLLNLALLPIAGWRFIRMRRRGETLRMSLGDSVGLSLLILSVLLAVTVFALGDPLVENFERSQAGAFPYVLLIACAIFIGSTLTRFDILSVLFLIFIEIGVGFAEWIAGTHSFFGVPFQGETQIGDTTLLYYNRVFGLSSNSSGYAFKVLVAFVIVLVMKEEWNRIRWSLALAVLAVGFATSFGRGAVVAAVAGWLIFNYRSFRVLGLTCAAGSAVALLYWREIVSNFTRGRNVVEASGRNAIVDAFMEILRGNPWLGNAARKVWVPIDGSLYHAHNSYLELLASNGLLISLIFILGYYLLVVRRRVRIATPLLIYSLFQYGIWWGLVFHDVIVSGVMFYVARRRQFYERDVFEDESGPENRSPGLRARRSA